MSGTEYYDNLTFSYRVGENHENQPALFMWGLDCTDASCGFTIKDLDTFITFLKDQRGELIMKTRDKNEALLFDNIKDENNG